VHFDDLSLEGEYAPWKSYGQSQIANLWIAREIEKRFWESWSSLLGCYPGSIATELLRHVPDKSKQTWASDEEKGRVWKSVEQGTATSVLAAVLLIQDVPRPTIFNETGAIVSIITSAICGSDLHFYLGFSGRPNVDHILGHEGLGYTSEAGSAVASLKIGDYVVIPDAVAHG
jgi:hypothetical protein